MRTFARALASRVLEEILMRLLCVLITLAGIRSASARPALDLAEPSAPPRREVAENGTSPVYYRMPPNAVSLLVRTSIGARTRWTGERDTAFTVDALAGAAIRFARDSRFGLWIEGGYSYATSGEHLALLGIGPVRNRRGLFGTTLALVPHAVAGRVDGQFGVGVRTSAIVSVGPLAFELAHQLLAVDAQRVHEMHAVFTFPFDAGARE